MKLKIPKLNRIVMEVFGRDYTCKQSSIKSRKRKRIYKKNASKDFKRILDELVPKYGNPQINLEEVEAYNGKRFTRIY